MKTIDIHEATAPLAEYAHLVATEPVIVMSDGKPLMALVDVEDVDFETISLSTNKEFLEIIRYSRERHEKEGGFSSKEMRQRMDLPDS